MAASFEQKTHMPGVPVWVGRYRNLHNLPHWHVEYELLVCHGGQAELKKDGRSILISDGSAAFLPSGIVHQIDAGEGTELIVAQIDPDALRFIGSGICLANEVFADRYQISARLESIAEELKMQAPFYAQRVCAMMDVLLIDIVRGEGLLQPVSVPGNTAAQFRELLSAIEAESEFITFTDAAARMHMSEAYFSRYFKQSSGMTFSQYLNLIKIDQAIGILNAEPGISTSDLALRCGFNTLRNFNRVFRKVTGYSPRGLPEDFSLQIRRYARNSDHFDPTLEGTVTI